MSATITQFKYALRASLGLRLGGLLGTLALNMVFAVCGGLGLYGYGGLVTAVVFSSFALCGILVINGLCDAEMVRSLYGSPAGYVYALAPVPAWRNLLARIVTCAAYDLAGYVIGICGIVLQSWLLARWRGAGDGDTTIPYLICLALIGVLYYLLFLTAIFFAAALCKSALYRVRGRGFLSTMAALAVLYLSHWGMLAVAPFGRVHTFGLYIMVDIINGQYLPLLAWGAAILAETALLFATAAHLTERRINL